MGCCMSCLTGRHHPEDEDQRSDDHNATHFPQDQDPLPLSTYGYDKLYAAEGGGINRRPSFSEYTHTLYSTSSTADEDVCPTCFEEYCEENPKITAKCKHHYHLGCIYEWKERSETCPTCRKVLDFSES
ncbi:hypothetical protein PHAVU_003G039100 [Phaseolus vulgaris]|uniref:RING-type E3 ubiquitin transferase n=1 Tax=Phaseolus vulgaris TaxID=3885 RepID=V7C5Q5_PHAVU|nr:hypothetical protein PHAVU_003G039100g [Phaseolus vulgaris]ESW25474.1 hypothetical protein PHAVU_003G039100g [Phaseolus vulgaris]